MVADRVPPLKQESAEGDLFPNEFDPNEDAVDVRGVFLQSDTSDDDTVQVTRDASDRLVFTDDENTTPVSLADLKSGGPLVKLLELIDTTGGLTVTNSPQTIPFDYEYIKDDYYSHSTSVNPGEVTILEDGLYKISAMITVAAVSTSGGARGNPQLHVEIDTGSGFVEQPDKMGGYVRENSTETLSCSITGIGLFGFSANDKVRITVYDSVTTEPDEETVPYSQRLIIEYIDRTGAASGVVNNLKDIGDVDALAPSDGQILEFDGATSKWVLADVDGLPPATEVGQMLYSYNGTTFEIVKPIVADDGIIITDDDGHIVVTETP